MFDFIVQIQPLLTLLFSVFTFIGIVIAVYKFSTDPDLKSSEEIKLINQRCELKHKRIDENLVLIKENHLRHIEVDIKYLTKEMVELKTLINMLLKNNNK